MAGQVTERLGEPALGEEPLGDVAVVDIRAAEEADQLVVIGLREIEAEPPGRLSVTNAVEAALQTIDAGGVAVRVLVAVVAVVPVEDVQAAVGTRFLDDGHEPGVVGSQEVGRRLRPVGRAVAL